jgi:hypothetical protein
VRAREARAVSICNGIEAGSRARSNGGTLFTRAGPELRVASAGYAASEMKHGRIAH